MTEEERQADRKRREYVVELNPATMPDKVADALRDLADVIEDYTALCAAHRESGDPEQSVTEYREFLSRHAITITRSAGVFMEASYLYAECEIAALQEEIQPEEYKPWP